jgi:hypothetical protein
VAPIPAFIAGSMLCFRRRNDGAVVALVFGGIGLCLITRASSPGEHGNISFGARGIRSAKLGPPYVLSVSSRCRLPSVWYHFGIVCIAMHRRRRRRHGPAASASLPHGRARREKAIRWPKVTAEVSATRAKSACARRQTHRRTTLAASSIVRWHCATSRGPLEPRLASDYVDPLIPSMSTRTWRTCTASRPNNSRQRARSPRHPRAALPSRWAAFR